MYKFLALGAHKELNAIKERLNQADLDFVISKFSDLEIFIEKDDVQITLHGQDMLDFDYVWLTSTWASRSIAYAVSLFLKKNDVRFFPVEEEKSKLVDMLLFGSEGISLPKTYFTGTDNIQHRLSSIVDFCGYPFIVKPSRGSLGKGIYLVKSEADFIKLIPKLKQKQLYICQEYIPNNFDYRIIIAEGEVVSACKRVRTEGFRNNSYLGAEEFFIRKSELPENIIKIAQDSTEVLGLNWSGVDILTSKETGESYILELNRRPGFTAGSSEISAAYNHILSMAPE